MVEIIPRLPTTFDRFMGTIQQTGDSLAEYFKAKKSKEEQEKAASAIEKLTGQNVSGLSPELQKAFLTETTKQQQKYKNQFELMQKLGLGDAFGMGNKNNFTGSGQTDNQQSQNQTNASPEKDDSTVKLDTLIPQDTIYKMSLINPAVADKMQKYNDTLREEGRHHENVFRKEKERERKEFEGERSYHTQFSKEIEKENEKLRNSIPKKEMALNLSRDAIENGNLGFFSKDKLADITGIDALRTSKGAQLITAAKENLLSNMSRASARAQNMWFEQRLNSMFPKIGQSPEANLTVQEMIEGELAIDKAYQELFDMAAKQDEEKHGYIKKDISRRVHKALEPYTKEVFNRTSYRLRELEEQEMGSNKLKSNLTKKVSKGTPLTLANAKLFKEKFGDNALKVAEKAGYYVPTIEEFQSFRKNPQEFREEVVQ